MLSENDIDFRVISREMDKYTRFGGDQKFTTKRWSDKWFREVVKNPVGHELSVNSLIYL